MWASMPTLEPATANEWSRRPVTHSLFFLFSPETLTGLWMTSASYSWWWDFTNLAVMVQCLLVLSVLFSSPACFPPLSVFLFITSPVLFPPHSPHLFSDPLVSVSVYIAFVLPHVFASSLRDAPCDSTSFGPSRCDCSVASPPVSSLVGMFGFWFLIFSFELSFAFLLHLV